MIDPTKKHLMHYQQQKRSDHDLVTICGIFESARPNSLLIIHLDEIDQILKIGPEQGDILPLDGHIQRFHCLLGALVAMANTKHTLYLSGRSPYIFNIGLGLPQSIKDSATTPEVFSIISLVLDNLGAKYIAKMLPGDFVETWKAHFEKNKAPVTFEEYVFIRTGGVPRLIIFAYMYLCQEMDHILQQSNFNILGSNFLEYLLLDVSGSKEVLSFTVLSQEDRRIFFCLAEWAQFQLPLKISGKFDLALIGGQGTVDLPMLLRRWQVYMEKVAREDHLYGKYNEVNEYIRLVFPQVVLESAAQHPFYVKDISETLLENVRAQFASSGHLWNPDLVVELLPLKTITRHFCLPIGNNILGDHFPFFKGSLLEHAAMKPLRGYRMPKMVVSEGSGGARVLRTESESKPMTPDELNQLQETNQSAIKVFIPQCVFYVLFKYYYRCCKIFLYHPLARLSILMFGIWN